MHWRTSRATSGARPPPGSPHRASTPREFFTTERVNPDEADLRALIFALAVASPLIVTSVVLFYLAS